jgi:hypothetical protein
MSNDVSSFPVEDPNDTLESVKELLEKLNG